MTTDVTTPGGRGAEIPDAGRDPSARSRTGRPLRSRRWRWATRGTAVLMVVALGAALVVNIARACAETSASHTSLATEVQKLRVAQEGLARAERQVAAARAYKSTVTGAFETAEAGLAATQAQMAKDDRGIYLQGIDLGQLDTCLSGVQQALNQLAVGQKAGGLASLRASSSACAALDTGGA